MTISCDYASPDNHDNVNYHFDTDSMTVYPAGHPAVVAFLNGGGTILAYITPPTPEPYVPATPTLIAMGQVILTDGDVSSVTISAALAGAFMFDVGEFWVFFLAEQPDTNYMALAYDGGSVRAFVQDDEKATDHFVIRTTDFTGTPMNPPALNFEIKRVI